MYERQKMVSRGAGDNNRDIENEENWIGFCLAVGRGFGVIELCGFDLMLVVVGSGGGGFVIFRSHRGYGLLRVLAYQRRLIESSKKKEI